MTTPDVKFSVQKIESGSTVAEAAGNLIRAAEKTKTTLHDDPYTDINCV